MEDVLKKLRYAGQDPVLVANAPDEMRGLEARLSAAGARVDAEPRGSYEWSIVFVKSLAETTTLAGTAAGLIKGDGILWLAYPKGASKRYSVDVNRDTAWPLFDGTGVRLVAQVSIDGDWSAMRLRRIEFSKA
jgi:hypothetical protein